MMCQTILMPLTYSNAGERSWTYLTCHMKERAWPLKKEEYSTEMLDSILEQNHPHGTPLSSKNLQESVIRVMEDEEKDA